MRPDWAAREQVIISSGDRLARTVALTRAAAAFGGGAAGAASMQLARWHDWLFLPLPLAFALMVMSLCWLAQRRARARHARTCRELGVGL